MASWVSPVEAPPGPGERANDYDSFAEAYAAENETSLLNAYYARPAIVDLAGDVTGRRILDAGCGAGPVAADLRERGAVVAGFDSSAGMLALARRRLGDDVVLEHAELGGPLPFADAGFDDVVASLVLHYLEDWTTALAELRRVLKPGGRLIGSVHHPFVQHLTAPPGTDYFAIRATSQWWEFGGTKNLMTFWDRPLHAITDAFTAAGFRIDVISEPAPGPGARERFPEVFEQKESGKFLCFLFFVLTKA
ncbi:class I SAM-dependent methyltransferase [Streptomyces sp. DSM 44915]|uniref:Class I SAM-dependent methyltransferase n=1 Tax=Streptomyces chisholmiae TaxID=3075540 RepID=A0ABU2JRC3_9ACTN|nr:class I SAM-dependent methyltransferase [Streptomyces sp. DSM 44915]MDT0267306.1 class I SAM-dependent methyltransferase [Streptomyces sp. DSM 44915]